MDEKVCCVPRMCNEAPFRYTSLSKGARVMLAE